MVLFYVLAGALALGIALALVWPLVGGAGGGASGGAGGSASREARDADLYRDQLAEIDRDVARGVMAPAEAEGARAEISRRLLAAADRAEAAAGPRAAPARYSRLLAGVAAVGAPALAFVVYLGVGAPGLPGMPLAERAGADGANGGADGVARLSQEEAEAMASVEPQVPPAEMEEYAGLIARLEQVIAERPGDLQGLELLANGYARLGRYGEAWRTWRDLIEAAGPEATAAHHVEMAEAMVMAAGGYVSAEARRALDAALAREPELPVARYYRALGMAQAGRVDEAIAAWERLRAEAPEDAPWLGVLERTLAEARALRDGATGSGSGSGTGPRSGPSAAEIAAAEAMSPEERQAMIEDMVARLEARLTSRGGEPEEWLRLMHAYVQLDRPGDAARVAEQGIASFGSGSAADFLREQSLLMGLEQPGADVGAGAE